MLDDVDSWSHYLNRLLRMPRGNAVRVMLMKIHHLPKTIHRPNFLSMQHLADKNARARLDLLHNLMLLHRVLGLPWNSVLAYGSCSTQLSDSAGARILPILSCTP